MSEKLSPFCPDNCNFMGEDDTCIDCFHAWDEVYKNPKTIEIQWCGEWVKAKIVGKSQGKLYIESDKGNFTLPDNSPHIK